MYDRLLVILYTLSYTHGCYWTHIYGHSCSPSRADAEMPVRRTNGPRMDKCVTRPAWSRSEPPWIWCMWGTSGYVYYGWLNYRNFGSHYRNFGSFFRNFGSSVQNVPAAYVETTQSSYNPSDCRLLVILYTLFYTDGCYSTHVYSHSCSPSPHKTS